MNLKVHVVHNDNVLTERNKMYSIHTDSNHSSLKVSTSVQTFLCKVLYSFVILVLCLNKATTFLLSYTNVNIRLFILLPNSNIQYAKINLKMMFTMNIGINKFISS